jgi:hypothetical protein
MHGSKGLVQVHAFVIARSSIFATWVGSVKRDVLALARHAVRRQVHRYTLSLARHVHTSSTPLVHVFSMPVPCFAKLQASIA